MSDKDSKTIVPGASVPAANGQPAKRLAPAVSAKQARAAAAKSLTQEAAWKTGAKASLRPFAYVAAVVLLFCLLYVLGVLPSGVGDAGLLLFSVVLFLLAIPLGLLLRMDSLFQHSSSISPVGSLGLALLIVFFNFLLVGALRGLLRGRGDESEKSQ